MWHNCSGSMAQKSDRRHISRPFPRLPDHLADQWSAHPESKTRAEGDREATVAMNEQNSGSLSGSPAARYFGTITAFTVALVLLFSSCCLSAQPTKKQDKYAVTDQERTNFQLVCNAQKYGPGGYAAVSLCIDENIKAITGSKRLRYFEGTWTLQGDVLSSPLGKRGHFSRVERSEWVESNWSLVSHWQEHRPSGQKAGTTTYEYDCKRNLYTASESVQIGNPVQSTGAFVNNRWSWKKSILANGKRMNARWIVDPVSNTSYKFKFELSSDNGKWTTVIEGTAAKSV